MEQETPSLMLKTAAPVSEVGDENAERSPIKENYASLQEINDSKAELLARVQSLRKDIRDWRGKLDSQVLSYRQELGELRNTLNIEVEQLKLDFQDLRLTLKKQLDTTTKLSDMLPKCKTSPPAAEKNNNSPVEANREYGEGNDTCSPPSSELKPVLCL
ncbi:hypothetical protein KP509_01G109300 [Ceratopteris richardii]|uniref:Uncharacterized protein n=1 Tax=Ceratopteris richardii TaxID=49495 RepID=A0A8T2VJT0_CERRI|nr:hypothetical protein KP509_01G109300 [Ceratopteris richardii]